MRIILHCGLAKTGTTFLQQNVFNLNEMKSRGIIYNPNELLMVMISCMHEKKRNEKIPEELAQCVKKSVNKIQADSSVTTIFCSYEPLAGGCSASWEFVERMKVIKELLPEAEIIVTLRYQTDWLVSLYKQYIHHAANPYKSAESMKILSGRTLISFEQFINYSDGTFHPRNPQLLYDNIGVESADWNRVAGRLYDLFGERQVNILFFEDFLKNPQDFVERYMKIIFGSGYEVNKQIDFKKRSNKGFSRKAIQLTQWKFYLTTFLPVRFNLAKIMDKLLTRLSERGSSDNSFRKRIFLRIRRDLRSLILYFGWPNFMRTIDRVFKNSGNLLGEDLRAALDQEFRKMNDEFFETLHELNYEPRIPEKYLNSHSKENFNEERNRHGQSKQKI